jgi:hypothetical protein
MKDKDKIIHYTQKYKITNYTTYEDLIHAIYNYELSNFVTLVYRGKDKYTHEYGMYLVSL